MRSIDLNKSETSRLRRLAPALALCGAWAGSALAAPEPPANPALQLSPSLGSAGPQSVAAGLATPVPGARISSPYGWRIHPILKVRRFHGGVDYAAPVGTPVHAAADGVVESMGRGHHFGLYLRIRHGGQVQTAYGHLGSFSRGLAVGSEVGAGEVIGTVGHSGWATGPHLDYEVIVNGQRVDPGCVGARLPLRLTAAERILVPPLAADQNTVAWRRDPS